MIIFILNIKLIINALFNGYIVHFDLNLSDTVTDLKTSAELINWLDTT